MAEQLKYKNQLKDASRVVEHIRGRRGSWVPVTIKVIQEITGVNASYASGVYQTLKNNQELETRKVVLNEKSQQKILEFRAKEVADEVKTDEKHKKYRSLTVSQVQHVEDYFKKRNVQGQEFLFQILNVLASHGGCLAFVENAVHKLANLLILRKSQVRMYVDTLAKYGFLQTQSGNPDNIQVIIGRPASDVWAGEIKEAKEQAAVAAESAAEVPQEPVQEPRTALEIVMQAEAGQEPAETQPEEPKAIINSESDAPSAPAADKPKRTYVRSKTGTSSKDRSKIKNRKKKTNTPRKPAVKPIMAAPAVETQEASPVYKEMTDSIISMMGVIGDFQAFMGGLAQQVTSGVDSQKLKDLQAELEAAKANNAALYELNKQSTKKLDEANKLLEDLSGKVNEQNTLLEGGNKVVADLIEENNRYKDLLQKANEEAKKQRAFHMSQLEVNTKVFEFMQERFQLLLSDINSTIVDFTRIPAWKLKPADSAHVQKQILNAVTSAIDEIVKANCSDSKFAKDA